MCSTFLVPSIKSKLCLMPKHDNRNIAVIFPGQVQTKDQLQFLMVSSPQDHHQIPTENTDCYSI